jgi:hypothetical protein
LLTLGFGVFVIIQALGIIWPATPTVLRLCIALVGYAIVAAGFFTLRGDLLAILKRANMTGPSVPLNRRSTDDK